MLTLISTPCLTIERYHPAFTATDDTFSWQTQCWLIQCWEVLELPPLAIAAIAPAASTPIVTIVVVPIAAADAAADPAPAVAVEPVAAASAPVAAPPDVGEVALEPAPIAAANWISSPARTACVESEPLKINQVVATKRRWLIVFFILGYLLFFYSSIFLFVCLSIALVRSIH
ncbi:MAG: hypothetical protein RRB22_01565 [Gammaproteobacteria bacterium]|nr:hypothetical protein [Gammaproteobacteria bacterium]